MSVFLTLGVYSLKVSNDFPMQSDSIPYIIIYYMFGVWFTFIALVWFVLVDYLKSLEDMHPFLIKLANFTRFKWLFCRNKVSHIKVAIDHMISKRKCPKNQDCCDVCILRLAQEKTKIKKTLEKYSSIHSLNLFMFWLMLVSLMAACLTIFTIITTIKTQKLSNIPN